MITTTVTKKDGTTQTWEPSKILTAINKASINSKESISSTVAEQIIDYVADKLPSSVVSVTDIHKLVENALMHFELFDTAREYISYRQSTKPDIFRKRSSILPYEYPEVMEFVKAIRDSYWVHTHFTWDTDIADFNNPNTPIHYKTVYTRCALSIAQIEVAVKSFWGSIDQVLPNHEFSQLAATFDESEARHFDTYRFVLELVGKNHEFDKLHEYPVLAKRYDSLRNSIAVPSDSRRDFLMKTILFSTFIENVSLFSQFLVTMSFDKFERLFPASTNGASATNLDETTHHLCGIWIASKIIEQNPTFMTDQFKAEVVSRALTAIETEFELIDWIFDNQDLPFITRDQVKQWIRTRMKDSLARLDIAIYPDLEPLYFDWFDGRATLLTNIDFFAKKGYGYDKGSRSYSIASVFGSDFNKEDYL